MADTPSDQALVPFVSVENMLALVHSHGLDRCLTELTDSIAADFARWETFDKTPRVAAHSAIGVIELMPVSGGTDYAFKFVNGHPSNTRLGLQTVTAFGALASVETGYPTLFSEMTLLTALRTAATSALATRTLARSDSQTAAIIGNGAQSEFQIRALSAVCGIKNFRLYDIDPSATQRCINNLLLLYLRCDSAFPSPTLAKVGDGAAHGVRILWLDHVESKPAPPLFIASNS